MANNRTTRNNAKDTATEPRRIEYQPLDEITPANRNPKNHNLTAIRRSISRFGFTTPAVLDERTGRLVAGHGRLTALAAIRHVGANPPEGVRLADDGTWLVPVLRGWASRSDAEAEAYLVADNRLTEVGGWNEHSLGELLSELSEVDAELLELTGFDAADVQRLLEAPVPPLDDSDGPGLSPASDRDAPDDFPSYDDESIPTEHQCPSCGYRWSGKSAPTGPAPAGGDE